MTISFNLLPGVSLGDAVTGQGGGAELRMPVSLNTSLRGTAQALPVVAEGLGILLLIAVLVMSISCSACFTKASSTR